LARGRCERDLGQSSRAFPQPARAPMPSTSAGNSARDRTRATVASG
jgi:hypothetical protein